MAKTLDRECDDKLAYYAKLMQAVSRGVACRHRFAKMLSQAHLHEEQQRLEAAMLIETHCKSLLEQVPKIGFEDHSKIRGSCDSGGHYYNPKTGVKLISQIFLAKGMSPTSGFT